MIFPAHLSHKPYMENQRLSHAWLDCFTLHANNQQRAACQLHLLGQCILGSSRFCRCPKLNFCFLHDSLSWKTSATDQIATSCTVVPTMPPTKAANCLLLERWGMICDTFKHKQLQRPYPVSPFASFKQVGKAGPGQLCRPRECRDVGRRKRCYRPNRRCTGRDVRRCSACQVVRLRNSRDATGADGCTTASRCTAKDGRVGRTIRYR